VGNLTVASIHPAAATGFASNADDYERTRPGYPEAAIEFLVATLGLHGGVTVADVAAGTGKLTRLLVPSGAHVVAVEPVAQMRAYLEATCPGAEVVDGVAEDLPFDDASVDAVTVAQAFHWFNGERAVASFARVLRPGGALAVVYNHRDRQSPWLAAVNELVEARRHETPHHWDGRWQDALAESPSFTALQRGEFDNPQVLTPDEFVGRIRSLSFVGAMAADAQAALLASVAALVAEHPDTAGRTELLVAQRTSVHTWRRG
jgi:SAM-dependent methyltransferase